MDFDSDLTDPCPYCGSTAACDCEEEGLLDICPNCGHDVHRGRLCRCDFVACPECEHNPCRCASLRFMFHLEED